MEKIFTEVFSEDEIREQLRQLGYENVSSKKLEEFKAGAQHNLSDGPNNRKCKVHGRRRVFFQWGQTMRQPSNPLLILFFNIQFRTPSSVSSNH